MATLADLRAVTAPLPRSYEAVVRGRIKYRVGRIVYAALSKDEATLGFGFPKEWRQALVDSEPEKFSLPGAGDMRYHWAHVLMASVDAEELRELIEGAWALCVPRKVADEYAALVR